MNKWKSVAFAFITTLLSTHSPAQISVIQQPGTVIASFAGILQLPPGAIGGIYSVPAGRYARLTDLIVSSRIPTGLCYFRIGSTSNPLVTYEMVVPNAGTLHIPFNNGPAFAPGETILFDRTERLGAQCADYLFFTVRGYLFTVP